MKSLTAGMMDKYRNLYESSMGGIATSDLEGRILDANKAFLDMVAYEKEEIKKMTYQQLTPAKWHNMEADIVKNQVALRGYSDEYEKEYMRKDGTAFLVSVRTYMVRDKQGKPIGMWAFIRDITERKWAEKKL